MTNSEIVIIELKIIGLRFNFETDATKKPHTLFFESTIKD